MKNLLLTSIFALILLFLVTSVHSQHLKFSEKSSGEINIISSDSSIILSKRIPFLAGLFSFILPGLAGGQMYNDEPGKVYTHLAISGASIALFIITNSSYHIDIGGGSSTGTFGIILFTLSVGTYIGNWLYSTIEAPISATNINKRYERQMREYKKHSLNILPWYNENKQFGFRINLVL